MRTAHAESTAADDRFELAEIKRQIFRSDIVQYKAADTRRIDDRSLITVSSGKALIDDDRIERTFRRRMSTALVFSA